MGVKRRKMTTPEGVAKYAWLDKPSTKFNADGEYTVTLLLPKEEAEDLVAELTNMVDEEAYALAMETIKPADKKGVRVRYPFKDEYDDEGNETGNVEFKFKMKAKVKSRKTGEIFEFKPDLFGPDAKALPKGTSIFGGTKMKVNFSPNPYYMVATNEYGVSTGLNAVQVTDLNGGGRSADSYGFDASEDYADMSTSGDSGDSGEGDAEDF